MKKLIFILSLIFAINAQSQTIIVPVQRISPFSDSSLFNFNPYTLTLSVRGGATMGNTQYYYTIIDSIAQFSSHKTPFGHNYTRSFTIEGLIQIPDVIKNQAFDSLYQPIPYVFNQILMFMDMKVDTSRAFIIQ